MACHKISRSTQSVGKDSVPDTFRNISARSRMKCSSLLPWDLMRSMEMVFRCWRTTMLPRIACRL